MKMFLNFYFYRFYDGFADFSITLFNLVVKWL